jgi:hypothetical protein
LSEIEYFVALLPDNEDVLEGWDLLLDKVNDFDENKEFSSEFLHHYFDDIQKGIIKIHNQICYTWFPRPEKVVAEEIITIEDSSQSQAQS